MEMKKAVLLITFNRLDTTKKVFEQIAIAKPQRLYLASDGPRANKDDEKEIVESVRKYLLANVNWECDVMTRFLDINSGGCRNGVSGALDWFFENEEDGIILEDDCVPNQSFFYFCEELLDYYKDDKMVWHIGGYNPLDILNIKESYYFSKKQLCWGWATWKDRWLHYHEGLKNYDDKWIKNISDNKEFQNYWKNILIEMQKNKIDSWAYQWTFIIIKYNGFCIHTSKNLISNIGFNGVHYQDNFDDTSLNMKTYSINKIIHPKRIKLDVKIINRLYKSVYGIDCNRKIFYITTKDKYIVIYLLGIKITLKSKTQEKLFELTNKYNNLKNRYDYLNEIVQKNYYEGASLLDRVKKYPLSQVSKNKVESVFFMNTIAKRGGAAKSTYSIADGVGRLGYKSYMYTGLYEKLSDEKYVKFLTLVNKTEYDYVQEINKSTGYLDFFFDSSFNIKNLPEFIDSDVLHLNNLHGGYFSMFALPEITALKPTIWTIRDECSYTGHCGFSFDCDKWEKENCKNCPRISLYQELPFDTASFILENKKRIYENIDVTIACPSMWTYYRAKKSILKNLDIRLVYNGIDNIVYKPYDKKEVRNELNLPQDKKVILFSCDGGTSNPWKGGEYISKVYEIFKHDKDLFFIAIGGYKDEMVENNYKIISYIDDDTIMAKYYSASDLFIYPSLADTFGRVVAEAIACSLPVITFNTGGIPEIIEHMKTGYIAEHRNVDDFIRGIKIFLDDKSSLENARKAGPKVVEEKFSNKIMVNNYLKLYNEAFDKRKRRCSK